MDAFKAVAAAGVVALVSLAGCAGSILQRPLTVAGDVVPTPIQCARSSAVGAGFMISESGEGRLRAYRPSRGPDNTEIRDEILLLVERRGYVHLSAFTYHVHRDAEVYLEPVAPSSDALRVAQNIKSECAIG